jgi:hydroxymethylpyrimidine pyrophosphatase-like HAD family hydrolase
MKQLLKIGIQCRDFFWPMHKQNIFIKKKIFKNKNFPVANFLSKNGFYIPAGIDITKKGEDKAYGAQRFSEMTGIPFQRILFVGDKLQFGGNDYPIIKTGIKTIEVANPKETQSLIQSWLA